MEINVVFPLAWPISPHPTVTQVLEWVMACYIIIRNLKLHFAISPSTQRQCEGVRRPANSSPFFPLLNLHYNFALLLCCSFIQVRRRPLKVICSMVREMVCTNKLKSLVIILFNCRLPEWNCAPGGELRRKSECPTIELEKCCLLIGNC